MAKRYGARLMGLARAPHRIRRLAKIARVLTKHGFGHIVQHFPFRRLLPGLSRLVRTKPAPKVEHISAPRRLAMVLDELGPTYVKLGQVLSTRPDLVPEEYVTELSRLQDRVTPFPSEKAFAIIEQELHRPIKDLFASVNPEPIAAGSIAQVYEARLPNGEQVIIKVKRPHVERIINDDIDLLALAAERLERDERFQPFRPMMLLEEFSRSLERELDFICEATYTEKFHRAFEGDERVRIAAVHWDLTTPSVLTLERIGGIPLHRREDIARSGVDLKRVGRNLADVYMKQYFTMGLFHADPHPGNLLIDEHGRVGIVDFGMIGNIDDELRRQLGTVLVGLVRKDLDLVVDVAIEIGAAPDDLDVQRLKSEMVALLDRYYGIPAKRVDLKRGFHDLMRLTREYGLLLPRDFVLLGKSLVTVAALTMQLDPEISMVDVVRPHAARALRDKFSPRNLSQEFMEQSWHFWNTIYHLPRDLRQLSRRALSGKFQFVLRHTGLESLTSELDRATNRIATSLIIASVVIGSSVVIHARMKPLFRDIPAIGSFLPDVSIIGFAGYVLAGVLGMILAIAFWRSGKL
jgi:ubiquinone biosynthesis protein